ncbi:2-methylaconitate cis-trans isomerase PrpF family protein [Paracoccus xiamenensis]|uniref:2-methylaconitate cis-trans isomerase PrpF family protein n=1 Tax=Paracoccus xiamenensis TaxID=2714901 RepID=UPI00140B2202|nr:PrpF domain-containing protein [Paracoccus xiamenensis]NHF71901.1 PrpF family protein [Paracoccus xiamenensis]
MAQQRIRAVFMRGGTSKGLVFHEAELPPAGPARDAVLLAAMGSPDPNIRQLDGMGGGISSLSKICIVGPSTHPQADVDFTFGQVGIDAGIVDYGGNCGNMSSAIGPFAVEEGLVPTPADGEAVVRIHNTNTGKLITARFPVRDGFPLTQGDFTLDGVAGTSAPIRLEFLTPGGAKTGALLPTGRAVDLIDVPDLGPVEVSLVDAANPMVFIAAESLGLTGVEMPDEIGADPALMARLEAIRRRGAVMMGLAPDEAAAGRLISIPKIAMLARSQPAAKLSGQQLAEGDADITARTLSTGQPHRAIPLTGALCLAAAIRVPGSVAARLATATQGSIRIAHPSGTISVDAATEDHDGQIHILHASVLRSARRLFEGNVCIPVQP